MYKASLLSSSKNFPPWPPGPHRPIPQIRRLLLEREARAPNLSSWLLLYMPMFFRSVSFAIFSTLLFYLIDFIDISHLGLVPFNNFLCGYLILQFDSR
ncbi:hypothetical protein GBA52_008976 [Prunus armeniaca]|nr:hypothetical protein GBA52_008976 [Prunus armeniaca]